MKEKVRLIIQKLHPRHVTKIFSTFLHDESISGKLILVAAILSMIVVNSPLKDQFDTFWHLPFSIGLGSWDLTLDLRHWLNEGLMAFFFLVVGLEIKRELVKGELKDKKTAILPIGAAVGGMVVPALIYLVFNINTDAVNGWGIPIATDIAFAIAILILLGKRVPVALKIFLLTLAIADDIGAIIVIALFYAEIIHYGYLFISVAIIISIFIFRRFLTEKLFIVISAGVLLWITTHLSGIHASIIGAAMGLLAPISTKPGVKSVSEKAEKLFLPITTFVILPLFAFANAGFILNADAIAGNKSVVWGIVGGLVIGKMVGITLFSWILTKIGVASLPDGVVWRHIIGAGFIAGIGFTVSIFITELAFAGNQQLIDSSKAAIFIASGASAILGVLVLLRTHRSRMISKSSQINTY
jgi:NhaA family Na+:H+ antiporter